MPEQMFLNKVNDVVGSSGKEKPVKEKKGYSVFPDGDVIVGKIVNMYKDDFPQIDVGKIICLKKDGESKKYDAQIRVVPDEYRLLTPYLYIVVIPAENWARFSAPHQHLILYHELKHIPAEFGLKLKKHDREDWKWLLHKFGLDYREGEGPDILTKKEEIK